MRNSYRVCNNPLAFNTTYVVPLRPISMVDRAGLMSTARGAQRLPLRLGDQRRVYLPSVAYGVIAPRQGCRFQEAADAVIADVKFLAELGGREESLVPPCGDVQIE